MNHDFFFHAWMNPAIYLDVLISNKWMAHSIAQDTIYEAYYFVFPYFQKWDFSTDRWAVITCSSSKAHNFQSTFSHPSKFRLRIASCIAGQGHVIPFIHRHVAIAVTIHNCGGNCPEKRKKKNRYESFTLSCLL